MSVSKQIDVLVMYYLTSHQALEFILGWLTLQAFWKVWLVGAICLLTFGISEIIDKYADGDGCMTWIALIILAIALYAATH